MFCLPLSLTNGARQGFDFLLRHLDLLAFEALRTIPGGVAAACEAPVASTEAAPGDEHNGKPLQS